MPNWEDFEFDCTKYLNNNFGDYCIFIHKGSSDSTTSDILAKTKNNKEFYIDTKHCPAQCGQFVLYPDENEHKFIYSDKNANEINKYSETIIDFMNNNFDKFKNAGTKGIDICFQNCEEIFYNWVQLVYKNKKVQFFISNNYKIVPINEFEQYYKISAKYRIKRSGSNKVSIKNRKLIIDYINNSYNITEVLINKNIFIKSQDNLDNIRFKINNREYIIVKRDDLYEIRQLSNTYNANVIFSIELKNDIDGLSDEEFIDYLHK